MKVILETEDWDYTCGDGCCYDWGTRLYVNGEAITVSESSVDVTAITGVLEALGHEVVHTYRDDDSFDARD
ncbi:hypothetical protein [Lysinibacillus fusiformis]|uniref:hypothetical protein n=1 Tax=Lysinibacillus fusiformis TaxID=28031 RepID=UPI00301B4503